MDKDERVKLNTKGFVTRFINSKWEYLCDTESCGDLRLDAKTVCNIIGFE